jgi:dTDP-4-amino-4,6-dideoxygalactose transaminase
VTISIPQTSPVASYLAHKDEIDAAISRVLERGSYILGQEVESFETEFAAYLGVAQAVGVANGTDALELALRACDVGVGDRVLTVSHTAVATVAAIEACGAIPVFVDIEPDSFTIDIGCLAETIQKLSGQVKAIVPVHLYGHPARISEIMELASRHDLRVIEDCAQAHGAEWGNRKVGAFGDASAFSFYPTKNLGGLGDGGAVVTADRELAQRVRSLREYGWEQRYISNTAGVNSRLDELQAAVLRVKLRHLDDDNRRRADIASSYSQAFAEHEAITIPKCSPQAKHVYHQYVIRTPARESLRKFLYESAIGTSVHYPLPVHQQPAYAGRILSPSSLRATEAVAQDILSLPIFAELQPQQLKSVINQVNAWHGPTS